MVKMPLLRSLAVLTIATHVISIVCGFQPPALTLLLPRSTALSASSSPYATTRFTGTVRPTFNTPLVRRPPPPPSLVPPSSIPDYAYDGVPKLGSSSSESSISEVSSLSSDMSLLVDASSLARSVLDAAGRLVRPGLTTRSLDSLVYDLSVKAGAYPSPLNYRGFPASCCTSVNEIVCHGIPDDRPLQVGDLLNIDVTVFKDGFHGDCSEMFVVGDGDEAVGVQQPLLLSSSGSAATSSDRHLLQVTYDAFLLACLSCRPGVPYSSIGRVIDEHVSSNSLSSIRGFCGHGIGRVFHQRPNVLHYLNDDESEGVMKEGHVFTIEPMIFDGRSIPIPSEPPRWRRSSSSSSWSPSSELYSNALALSQTVTWGDGWTAATANGKRSAQFEHTLIVTKTGVLPLTAKREGLSRMQWWEEESTVQKGFFKGTG